jgi:peroxiredoxin
MLWVTAGLTSAGDELPIDRGIGTKVPEFTLKDTSDKPVRLYGYAGKKAAVVVFIGGGCPVSDLYLPRLAELAAIYEKKNIAFIAIDSNRDSDTAKVAEACKQAGIRFPVLKDPGNVVADSLLAERTCEALVVDGKNAALLYRGAIDDQYTPEKRREKPSKSYLIDALDDVLAGREVRVRSSTVAGCPIERAEAKVPPKPKARVSRTGTNEKAEDVGKVTYAEAAPIVRQKCQGCHRPGDVGPFSLLTYDQVRRRGASIREAVDERRMPPWHADPKHGKFKNDRSLSSHERAVILAWIEQGMPKGDAKEEVVKAKEGDGWHIGNPDHVFEMPKPYTVPAQGVLPYQHFRVPTNFKEDTWVRAIEVRPGERSVVHHVIVYVVDGKADDKDGKRRIHLSTYAPGLGHEVFPEGAAKLISAGSDLVFEMHYTPMGRMKSDRSSVGLVLAKEPVKKLVTTVGIFNRSFKIPPGDGNHAVESSFTVPRDAQLLGLFPHMHLRGKDFRYVATYPDGSTEVLLDVPAYDFGWQTQYLLAEAKALPKGTKIECFAHFDNSDKNPANPDPKRTVRWGRQTADEMMIGFIDLLVDAKK